MAKVVLYMSMSLDGFITGPDDGLDHGLGVNGERLHDWLRAGGLDLGSHRPVDGPSAIVFDRPAGWLRTYPPTTSSSNCSAPWTGRVCCTCATACDRRAEVMATSPTCATASAAHDS
jgi:hypothetical protein